MKILRIKIKNLASIAGEHLIDFTAEPLRSAGLFAICGPTGSGKSTILDAICLALFNNIPRTTGIEGARVTDVGKEQIQQSDRRQILRRGTTDGIAEVEFTAVDGRNYRSTWHVWRANGKVGGKLQPADLRVTDLHSGREITSGISESETRLRELTGLTYEQFTRTVLLAQNDFARFLKARKDEKAEVLEKLTGTEIYSVISNTVYNRCASAKDEWRNINDRIGSVRLLSPEELNQMTSRQNELTTEETAFRKRQEEAVRQHEWAERLAILRKEQEEAATLLQSTRQALEYAAPQIETLKQAEAAAGASEYYHGKQQRQQELNSRKQELSSKQTRLEATDRMLNTIRQQYETCNQKYLRETETFNGRKPLLIKARELDVQIRNAQANLDQTRKNLADLTSRLSVNQRQWTDKEEEIKKLNQQLSLLDEWFQRNSRYEQMCLNMAMITGFLDTASATRAQSSERQGVIRELARQTEEVKKREEESKRAWETAQTTLAGHLVRKQEVWESIRTLNINEIRKQKNELTGLKDLLNNIISLEKTLRETHSELIRQRQADQDIRQKLTQVVTRQDELGKQAETLRVQRDTSRQLYEDARLASSRDVAALRQQLREGTPCPVCGSAHHPATHETEKDETVLNTLKESFGKYEALYRETEAELIRLEQDRKHLEELLSVTGNEIVRLEKVREGQAHQLSPLCSEAKLPASQDESSHKEAEERLNYVMETLRQIDSQENGYTQKTNILQQLEQETEKLSVLQENAAQEMRSAQEELNRLSASAKQEEALLKTSEEQITQALEKITEHIPIDNWRERWATDSESFRRDLDSGAARWNGKRQEEEKAREQRNQLQNGQAEIKRATEELIRQETALQQQQQQQSGKLNDLNRERASLLEGRNADEVESEWLRQIEEARKQMEQTVSEKEKQTASHQQLTGELSQLGQHIENLEKQCSTYANRLSEWLHTYNETASSPLTEETLGNLLGMDSGRLRTERAAIQSLREQLTRAEATFRERENQISRHRENCPIQNPDEYSSEKSDEYIQSLKQKLEDINRQKVEISAALRTHQQNCEQVGKLRGDLDEAARIMEQWAKLDELIGSQSGNKFKEIAQGYTLDLLLTYANRQLRELTGRYQLQRVPDELALQIVDHDMCDEIRPVFSLSGGESFLVSLALALGLSAFSSRNHHEENLFIDEGFGTLDAETLQVVMEALERLRSQGRKVGVISHVQEMAERIPVRISLIRTGNGKSNIKITG